jgi:peptidoglycan hydrolase-like protein with peptidoglycan-binding domain
LFQKAGAIPISGMTKKPYKGPSVKIISKYFKDYTFVPEKHISTGYYWI